MQGHGLQKLLLTIKNNLLSHIITFLDLDFLGTSTKSHFIGYNKNLSFKSINETSLLRPSSLRTLQIAETF